MSDLAPARKKLRVDPKGSKSEKPSPVTATQAKGKGTADDPVSLLQKEYDKLKDECAASAAALDMANKKLEEISKNQGGSSKGTEEASETIAATPTSNVPVVEKSKVVGGEKSAEATDMVAKLTVSVNRLNGIKQLLSEDDYLKTLAALISDH
ncbi:hypothetical protein TrRE_jg11697 [Triparma retinervis]|nr:hypothetical protein TrRE_jg11697 [Triparma retinervis]